MKQVEMKQVEMGRGGVMFDGLKSTCVCGTDRKNKEVV